MEVLNATTVRKEWSTVLDNAVRVRPQFLKRTRDELMLANIDLVTSLLDGYSFTVMRQYENDGYKAIENLITLDSKRMIMDAKRR